MKNPNNIVITGASSGIGLALAKAYALKNRTLLLLGRNKERLEKCQKICNKLGANSIINICDVKEKNRLNKIIKDFNRKHPIDLAIANAGISAGTSGKGENYTQLKEIYDTNIYGVINTIDPLIEDFKSRKSGQIAIISSIASFRGLPSAPAYSSSKACIRYYAEALRGELSQHNISVNIICPGYIKTPLTDKNKFPMPLLMEADYAAKHIKTQLSKNKALVIFPKTLYYIIKLCSVLPSKISDKIFAALPKK